jgi:hypothetical protein
LPAAGEITLINTVPSSMWELVKNDSVPASVGVVNLAGEALHRRLVDGVYGLGRVESVYNLYGPTEDTVYSTGLRIEADDNREPSIGKPIANKHAVILDEKLEPLPAGAIGELFIGGAGLARGYLNRPEATSDRFIPDPFSSQEGRRLYRTGDSVRYRADGSLEFLGRVDRQIKLRGFRIELGEIEAVLERNDAVEKAVAIVESENDGNRKLIGYVAPRPSHSVTPDQLRRYLRERLPAYMIPSSFFVIEEFPLLPNGKVDRSRLEAPCGAASYVPPSTEIEETLCDIWATALGAERIGVTDDFHQAGGNSLSASMIATRIYKRLNRNIEIKAIYAYPTVRELAGRMLRIERAEYAPITAAPKRKSYRLTPAQKRFWIQDRFAPAAEKSVEPAAFMLEGDLDFSLFERAFRTLIERHEILRTVFLLEGKEPKQKILKAEETGFRIERIDISGSQDPQARLRSLVMEEAGEPMDLSQSRLLRVKLVKLGRERHACICSLHHIITDGWSNVVLANEFLALYEAYAGGPENPLPPLKIQYKDYAEWLGKLLGGPQADEMRKYWRTQLGGRPPETREFPTDFDRHAAGGYKRRTHRFVINEFDRAQLEAVCRDNGATLFIGLMACLKSLLVRCTGREEIIVGSPAACRIHPDLENQIGPYLNVIPIRDIVRLDARFIDLLSGVRDTTFDAYANQLYPFDFILADLGFKRDGTRNPIFDVGFTLQNQTSLAVKKDDARLRMSPISGLDIETESPEALTDFWFVAEPASRGLEMLVVYNGSLFRRSTVERLAEDLTAIIHEAATNPEIKIGDLKLVSDAEPLINKVTIDLAFS